MASPMTAAPARPFTYEDLGGMPDDGYRREIIGGSLVVTPAPNAFHQRAVRRLLAVLTAAAPDGMEALPAPFDWRPSSGDVYEPDLLVIRATDVDDRGFLRPGTNPVLAVEVLSSNRIADLVTKRAVYEASGLPWYWIVDPMTPSLLALRLGPTGTYEVQADLTGDDTLVVDDPFSLQVSVGGLGRP